MRSSIKTVQSQNFKNSGQKSGYNTYQHPNTTQPNRGILKQSGKQSSLAAQYGITRKDPATQKSETLGLNPNVNIEDQYIENLLKQIHFMSLEVKLLKEKQDENKGKLGIAGLLSSEGKPLVEHVVQAETKFLTMKQDLIKNIIDKEAEIKKLDEENDIYLAKKSYFTEELEQLKKTHDNMINSYDQQMEQLQKQLELEGKKRALNQNNFQKATTNFDQLEKQLYVKNLVLKLNLEELLKIKNRQIEEELFKEEMQIDEEDYENHLKNKGDVTEKIKTKKHEAQSDEKYQQLVKDNQSLKEKLKYLEKKLSDINYSVMEQECLQNLSMKQKEIDIEEKKRLFTELEKNKNIYEELVQFIIQILFKKQKTNELKIEKRIRDNDSDDIRKENVNQLILNFVHQANINKLQNELEEIIAKFERNNAQYKKLLNEVLSKTFAYDFLVIKNKQKEEVVEKLAEEQEDYEKRVGALQKEIANLRQKITEQKNEQQEMYQKKREAQLKNLELTEILQFLDQNVDLNSDLKAINVDDLRKLQDHNQDINETIHDFLQKWEQINKFSKASDMSYQGSS